MSFATLPIAGTPRAEPGPNAPPVRPWREVGFAALFILSASLLGVAYAAGTVFAARGFGMRWTVHGEHHVMIVTIGVINVGFLYLAIRRAWVTADNGLRAALALGPMRRVWLVVLLLGAQCAIFVHDGGALLSSPLCRAGARTGMNPEVVAAAQEGPFWLTLFLLEFTILTAVSEEVLFRGWLWTALRRRWGAWPTALVTGGMFWAMHLPYGLHGVVILLPITVTLTAVRHWTGSIRGTIILHTVQNTAAAVFTLMLLWRC